MLFPPYCLKYPREHTVIGADRRSLSMMLKVSQGFSEFISTVAGTVIILIFGEITPKLIGTSDPENFLIKLASPLNVLRHSLHYFSNSLSKLAVFFLKMAGLNKGKEDVTETRLLAALEQSESSGIIRDDEKDMIHGIFESQDLVAKDVMVPRPKMVVMQEDKSALDLLHLMTEEGYTRIPLYTDFKDSISKIANIKNIAVFIAEHTDDWAQRLSVTPCSAFASPAHFVPESKNVLDLLYEMRSEGIHMAIVVDEYDGVSGLVTMEDLLEVIVGDIQDEYDEESEDFPVRLSENKWELSGSTSLAAFADLTGIDIETEECDTIGGLVMNYLERVPEPGDCICWIEPKLLISVLDVKGPRIERVLVESITFTQGEMQVK